LHFSKNKKNSCGGTVTVTGRPPALPGPLGAWSDPSPDLPVLEESALRR